MNCEPIECPICYEVIGVKNNITTECGHQFHASCIMKNVTVNGFGCPCCRTAMAEEADDDDDSDTPSLIDDDDDTATLLDDDREPFSDDALRGLRLLTNLLEGEDHDQYDVVAEHQYLEEGQEDEPGLPVPTVDIIRMLREQGVTYEQLVESLISDHEEYIEDETLQRTADQIWGQLRTIISNYEPAPVVRNEAQVVEAVESPIHVAADEIFEIEMPDMGYTSREIAQADLGELRFDLNRFMSQITINTERTMIHV